MKKVILIIILVFIILGVGLYLSGYDLIKKDKGDVILPKEEVLPVGSSFENQNKNNIKEEINKEETENSKVEDTKPEVKVDQKKLSCEADGGVWFIYNSSCEINSLSKSACMEKGGKYNECNSACRHDKEAVMCTMQCVMTCTFK